MDESSSKQGEIDLMIAAYYGDALKIKDLTERSGLNFHADHHHSGAMALFLAVERRHTAAVQALLTAGLIVDATDSIGQTSLHRATRRENGPIIQLLLDCGAEVDRKDDEGRTAWSANVRRCNESILSLLKEAGADPSTKGHDGITELYEAAAKGETDYVKKLLVWGTNPSITTRYSWTPPHWAANNGNIGCVQLLIEAGANVSVVSDQGTTPLDMAVRANQHTTSALLRQAGAKRSHETSTADAPSSTVAPIRPRDQDGADFDAFNVPGDKVNTQDFHPPEKLSLSFDKPLGEPLIFGQLIYPSNFRGTQDYYYQISHPVSTPDLPSASDTPNDTPTCQSIQSGRKNSSLLA